MTNQPPQGQSGPSVPQYQPPGPPPYQPVSGSHYRPPGPAAYQPAPAPGAPEESPRGFFVSLFDFNFSTFVTPQVIKVLYVLAMVLAVLGALGLAAMGFAAGTAIGFFTLIILCPIYLFLVVLFYRVALEFVIVVFRMGEDIHALRNRGPMR